MDDWGTGQGLWGADGAKQHDCILSGQHNSPQRFWVILARVALKNTFWKEKWCEICLFFRMIIQISEEYSVIF